MYSPVCTLSYATQPAMEAGGFTGLNNLSKPLISGTNKERYSSVSFPGFSVILIEDKGPPCLSIP